MPQRYQLSGSAADFNRNLGGDGTIPIADPQHTATIEQRIRKRCDPLIPRIHRMHQWMLDAFIWKGLFAYDLERGLTPGQVPHRRHETSPEFAAWEDHVLTLVEARQDELDQLEPAKR